MYIKEKNVNLTKLAINFSINQPAVDMTIVSMSSVDIVKDNVNFISDLSEYEKEVLDEIRKK